MCLRGCPCAACQRPYHLTVQWLFYLSCVRVHVICMCYRGCPFLERVGDAKCYNGCSCCSVSRTVSYVADVVLFYSVPALCHWSYSGCLSCSARDHVYSILFCSILGCVLPLQEVALLQSLPSLLSSSKPLLVAPQCHLSNDVLAFRLILHALSATLCF